MPVALCSQHIDSISIKKHIYYLASDKLHGRAPGTKGEKKAAQYISAFFSRYGLIPKGENGYFQKFEYHQPLNPHDSAASKKKYTGRNVIGYLDNDAPYTIVIGAHFDHLGTDGRGSSLDSKPKGKIHNGADDNASGTAGVLELARYFSSNNLKEGVNFLFVCFSAEEAGLIGSKHFTSNPTIPLYNIQCMVNMDMIGRLVDSTQKLIVYGVGTSDVMVPTLNILNQDEFILVLDSSGVGPSDQTSFYLKQIPVLHFFTGQHSEYHKPADDADKINYPGEAKVLEYIRRVTEKLATFSKMKFYETRSKDTGGKASFKVTLGIMPDYSFQGKGVRVDAVTKGKPAEKAGIKNGDIIVKLGDTEVTNIYDYMSCLSKFKAGDKTTLALKRENNIIQTSVIF